MPALCKSSNFNSGPRLALHDSASLLISVICSDVCQKINFNDIHVYLRQQHWMGDWTGFHVEKSDILWWITDLKGATTMKWFNEEHKCHNSFRIQGIWICTPYIHITASSWLMTSKSAQTLKEKLNAPCIPKWTPIQVLTRPNIA